MRPNEEFYNLMHKRNTYPIYDPQYITISGGGTEYNMGGGDTLLVFNSSGSITVVGNISVRYLVVGRGAAGSGPSANTNGNHGGGAGSVTAGTDILSSGVVTITVADSGNSTSYFGAHTGYAGNTNGNSGGGYTPASQSTAVYPPGVISGGGGGAAANAVSDGWGLAGMGVYNDITGSNIIYGLGGGGGIYSTGSYTGLPTGSDAWIEQDGTIQNASTVTANRGYGGHGGAKAASPVKNASSSAGGSGVVILRYTKIVNP